MSKLDERINEHFDQLRLSDEMLEKLLLATDATMQEHAQQTHEERTHQEQTHQNQTHQESPARRFAEGNAATDSGNDVESTRTRLLAWAKLHLTGWRMMRAGSVAALLTLIAVFMHGNGTLAERRNHMVKEVAMNHGTRFDLEFNGDSLAAIDQSMRLLPFSLALPDQLDGNVDVVGSRYCSLAGKLAAHVRFMDKKTGKPVSLFVTGMVDELRVLQGQSSELQGVQVKLWREGGLFFALANQS